MPMSRKKRRAGLAQASNYFGEQAALLYLDGRYELALDAVTRAVKAAGTLHRWDRKDRDVVEVLADGLRDRAEIQSSWARTAQVWDTPQAHGLIKDGIADADRALDLYDELATASDGRFPARPAETRMTLSELHSMAGHDEPARRHAELSMVDYRRYRDTGTDLSFARALGRYADVVAAERDLALAARRESVELSRPHARPDGWLWTTRFDRGLIWLSTPTLARFCRTANFLAEQLGVQDASTAAEAMLALQDAAEGYAGLIVHLSLLLDPRLEGFWLTSSALKLQAEWLQAIGEPGLADAYQTARRNLATCVNGGWHELVAQLRPPLEEVTERLSTSNGEA